MGFGVALFKAIFRRIPLDLSKNAAPKNPIGKNMVENSSPNITILVQYVSFGQMLGTLDVSRKCPMNPMGSVRHHVRPTSH